ncbi:MAG: hypothetical protein CVV59_01905 [Tenericutes bacterium HGW-Tenericutes-4]|nr:MAG: hypothetical protein CVV59_01905 [Tenericutes bacterium HGW-Tenericutes-4]
MRKIGAFAGKFLPPHIGHIRQIGLSADYCDELRVVVAEDPSSTQAICNRNNLPNMDASLRLNWLAEHFKHNRKIKIVYMNESNLPKFPDGLKEWSERFKDVVGRDVNVKFADETYRQLNETYFPECEFVAFDRTIIPISASLIRSDPKKYFNYLIDEAKPYFKKIIKEQNK